MQLTLTDAQVHVLRTALDSYYSELRDQIHHTDDYDARQTMKALERELELIREQLEPGWIARTGADRDDRLAATPFVGDRAPEGEMGAGPGAPPVGLPTGD
jgi:hypothetical protein